MWMISSKLFTVQLEKTKIYFQIIVSYGYGKQEIQMSGLTVH